MSYKLVSEQELKNRLSAKMSDEEIEELVFAYTEASAEEAPRMEVINELVKRSKETNPLRVGLTLSQEQYDALGSYYGAAGEPPTNLVRRALEEFIGYVEP